MTSSDRLVRVTSTDDHAALWPLRLAVHRQCRRPPLRRHLLVLVVRALDDGPMPHAINDEARVSMATDDRPRIKEIKLRLQGADADVVERLLDNVGKAIGHPGEKEVIVRAALLHFAGTLGVA